MGFFTNKKHITSDSGNALTAKVSQPLFSNSVLNHFGLHRIYPNGNTFTLTSQQQWVKDYIQLKYYDQVAFDYDAIRSCALLWRDDEHNETIYNLAESYDLKHGITFVQASEAYVDLYLFATDLSSCKAAHFYLNHSDLLKRFMVYYKSVMHKKIDRLDSHSNITKTLEIGFKPHHGQQYQAIIAAIQPEQLTVVINNIRVTLSQKEIDCLSHLIQGSSAKTIARHTDLSHRTVEKYIATIRKKTQTISKEQLIQAAQDSDFYLFSQR